LGTAWEVRLTVSTRRRRRSIISSRVLFRQGIARQQTRGRSTAPASGEERRNTMCNMHYKNTDKTGMEAYYGCAHGCGAAPRRKASLYKSQSSSYKQARATYVMLGQASFTSLACTQSPKPLSDAQVD